jgi:hypothetical protein
VCIAEAGLTLHYVTPMWGPADLEMRMAEGWDTTVLMAEAGLTLHDVTSMWGPADLEMRMAVGRDTTVLMAEAGLTLHYVTSMWGPADLEMRMAEGRDTTVLMAHMDADYFGDVRACSQSISDDKLYSCLALRFDTGTARGTKDLRLLDEDSVVLQVRGPRVLRLGT